MKWWPRLSSQHSGGRGRGIAEFESRVVCRGSCRTDGHTQGNPVSETQTHKTQKKKKKSFRIIFGSCVISLFQNFSIFVKGFQKSVLEFIYLFLFVFFVLFCFVLFCFQDFNVFLGCFLGFLRIFFFFGFTSFFLLEIFGFYLFVCFLVFMSLFVF